MKLLLLALLSFSAHADEPTCLSSGTTCAEVDMDLPGAQAAYLKGCDANDAYACSRLGQFQEVKKHDDAKALAAYERGCQGKDNFGCEQAGELRPRLCFLDKQKKFCDGKEPTGDFRVLVFLQTLNPKYGDAFNDHDFDKMWNLKELNELFDQRVKERNKVVLRALEKTMKTKKHDGSDAEMVKHWIKCIKGKCPPVDEDEDL